MPAPAYSVLADARYGKRQVVKFGGLPIPVVGGTQAFIDLMDGVNWYIDPRKFGLEIKIDHRLTSSPYLWRQESAFQTEDYWPTVVTLPILYDESNGISFQTARAALLWAGSQFLTFDNATGLVSRLSDIKNIRMRVDSAPYLWEAQLEFTGYEPWWKDFTSSTQTATALTASIAGTLTNFNITSAGSWWTKPVFTLDVPSTHAFPVSKIILANTIPTPAESLTVSFSPTLTVGTHWIVTIDCGNFTVTDQNGKQYDFSGSFPQLYPPAGTVNTFQATLFSTGGAATNVTLTPAWTNRWAP